MDRRTEGGVALVVVGLLLAGGGLFVYEVPRQHVHDARFDLSGDVENANGTANATALREALAAYPGPRPAVLHYGNLSPEAKRLYRETVRRGGTYRTARSVGAPEFNYSVRTVSGPRGEYEAGHAYVVVHTNASASSMPPGYDGGPVDGFRTRTERAELGSGHHVPRVLGLLGGIALAFAGGYLAVANP